MAPEEYISHDATGLAALIRTGEVSAEEIFEAFVSRVAAANPVLSALVSPDYVAVRATIRAGLPDGRFRGVS
jgi:amidase